MRSLTTMLFIVLCLSAVPVRAQEKVAEGEYQARGQSKDGTPQSKTFTRWVLYERHSGGYHLESEYLNTPTGVRVVQVEDLDSRLAPSAIGYELYRDEAKIPVITVTCKFHAKSITCGGEFENQSVPESAPYKQNGPFYLWMEGLFAFDMQWLVDGTVNLANCEHGKNVDVPTISVLGGTAVLIGDAVEVAKIRATMSKDQKLITTGPDRPTRWDIYSDETSQLQCINTERLQVGGVAVNARHYTFANGGKPMDLWTVSPGILIKLADEDNKVTFELANYKQYKKLIPDLPVDGAYK